MSDERNEQLDAVEAVVERLEAAMPSPDAIVAAANETIIAAKVREGAMPPEILDHVGHLKHGVSSASCQYCEARRGR